MDIEKITNQLKKGVEDNYRKHGSVTAVSFMIKNGNMVILPAPILKLFTDDKDKFYEIVRSMVKSIQPDAVILISEVWFILDKENGVFEQPSKSKNRREAVLLTVDTKNRQITYFSEIREKKMGEWKTFSNFDKTKPNKTELRGNMPLRDFIDSKSPDEYVQEAQGYGR